MAVLDWVSEAWKSKQRINVSDLTKTAAVVPAKVASAAPKAPNGWTNSAAAMSVTVMQQISATKLDRG